MRYRVRCLLRTEWRATLGIALVVAVVGGIVLTLVAGAFRTQSAPDRYEEALDDTWDTALEQVRGPPLTDEIAALPAVDDVAATTFFFGGLLPESASGPADVVEGITFAGDVEALLSEVVEGRAFDVDTPGEFVASSSWIEVADAEIGDRFTLVTISRESALAGGFDAEPDGPTFEATLVGRIVGAAELQDEFPLAMFPASLIEGADIGTSASPMLVSLVDGFDLADLREQLDGLPEGPDLTLDDTAAVPQDLREAVGTQTASIVVVMAIAAAAGLVVVGQVAVRRVRASADQGRALQAIGFSRAQRLADGVARVLVPAGLGAVLAGGLAVLVSGVFPLGFVERIEPEPGLRFDPRVHLLGPVLLVVGLVATVGLLLAIGTRTRRPRVTLVDRLSVQLGHAKAAMGLRFAFARHARDAGSLSTPLAGLVALVVTLTAAVTFGSSFDDLVEDPVRWGHSFELTSGQGGFEAVPDDVQQTVLADPDVDGLTLLGSGSVNVDERSLDLTGFEPVEGDFDVEVLDGRLPATDDELALGERAADDFGVGVGDEIDLRGTGEPLAFTVTGLAVIPGVEGTEGVGQSGLLTAEALRTLDEASTMTAMGIDVRDGADVEAVRARLSEATDLALGPLDRPTVIANYARVRAAPWIVAGLLGGLLALTVANLVALTLNRRGRDLAVLRALGADRQWISRVEHWHALALGVLVGGLSALVGIAAGRVVFRWRVTGRIGAADDTVVPVVGVLLGLLALVLLADLVAQVAIRWRHRSVARRLAVE